jgi:hypothetical protein
MARAYRRKRKGKFLGSFRLPLGAGTEVNLRTTDAIEAARRESAVRAAYARDEIQKCLAELGAEGEELGEQLFDGMAAAVLWFEGWAISKGINWRLKKQGRPLLEAAPGDEKALCRRLLRIGLKAEAIERWPWILDALTPKAAIVLGLALGAASAANSLQFARQVLRHFLKHWRTLLPPVKRSASASSAPRAPAKRTPRAR